jgi:hypothetical protein
LKVEILDVRSIERANARGAMERAYLVYYHVDNGPTERLEVPGPDISQAKAQTAIMDHIRLRESVKGTFEA